MYVLMYRQRRLRNTPVANKFPRPLLFASIWSAEANDAVSVRWRLHFAALCIALPVMMISRAATIVAQNTSKQLFYQGFNIIPDWQHAPDPVAPTSTQRESQPIGTGKRPG